MTKAKVLKCVFSKKGKLLRVVPDTKAKSSRFEKQKWEAVEKWQKGIPTIPKEMVWKFINEIYEQGKKDVRDSIWKQANFMTCLRRALHPANGVSKA